MTQLSNPVPEIAYLKLSEALWGAYRGTVEDGDHLANYVLEKGGKWVLQLTEAGHGLPKPLLAELETAREWLNDGSGL